jgi:hypothetical protein
MTRNDLCDRLNMIAQLYRGMDMARTAPAVISERDFLIDLQHNIRRLRKLVYLLPINSDDDQGIFDRQVSGRVMRLLDAPMKEAIGFLIDAMKREEVDRLRPPAMGLESTSTCSSDDEQEFPESRHVRVSTSHITPEAVFGGRDAEEILPLAAQIIDLLELSVALARKNFDPTDTPEGPEVVQSDAEDAAIAALLSLFEEAFGRNAAVSRDVLGRPSGPTIRFVTRCIELIGIERKSETIIKVVQKRRRSG